MCAVESSRSGDSAGRAPSTAKLALRIEPVDNWHGQWQAVLSHIQNHGSPRRLRIDADGWLSARQVLMVALVGGNPAAHVCFSVSPASAGGVEAKLESHGIDPRFISRGIESQLHRAAIERAQFLSCTTLRGFKLSSKWC